MSVKISPSSGSSGSTATIYSCEFSQICSSSVLFDNSPISSTPVFGGISIVIPSNATVGNHYITVDTISKGKGKGKKCCKKTIVEKGRSTVLFKVTSTTPSNARIVNLGDYNFPPFVPPVPVLPTIFRLSSSSGTQGSSVVITIFGANFAQGSSVTLIGTGDNANNSELGLNVVVLPDGSQITFVMPAAPEPINPWLDSGVYYLTVTSPNVANSNTVNFEILPHPV
jgi:hypothetical protein